MPFTLAALSDEIAPDLGAALETMRALDITQVEIRTLLGKNVLDLSDDEAAGCHAQMVAAGFTVAGLASPIGKSRIDRPAVYEAGRLRRALELCRHFDTRRVRVFSFYPPEQTTETLTAFIPEVVSRLRAMAEAAEAAGVLLVLENEFGLVGDLPTRIQEILTRVDSPALRFAWDPGNFVQSGVAHPFAEAWPLLSAFIGCCHVKDYRASDAHAPAGNRASGEHVPAGQGDGEWPELITALAATGGVPLVMEPHMKIARHSSGFSGPELFQQAVEGIRRLLPVG